MELRSKLLKQGGSYVLRVPMSLITVFNLLKYKDDYEWEVFVANKGRTIIYKRVKKIKDKAQTKLGDYKK